MSNKADTVRAYLAVVVAEAEKAKKDPLYRWDMGDHMGEAIRAYLADTDTTTTKADPYLDYLDYLDYLADEGETDTNENDSDLPTCSVCGTILRGRVISLDRQLYCYADYSMHLGEMGR